MSKYRDRSVGFEECQKATERPVGVRDVHLEYLDELRESGDTNMFDARPYLMEKFPNISEQEAAMILGYWMKSFGKPNR